MDVGIIGSGIIGLLSALTLTDAGYKVTIIARDLPGDENPDWASPWAGAAIFPHPDAAGRDLQEESFKYYWALAHRDPTSGVQVLKATEFYDDRDDDSSIWYKYLVPRYRKIPSKDLPRGAKIGFSFQTMTVNPARFLPWLQKLLETTRGVRFIRRHVPSIDFAREIAGCNVIVNATGLGALSLAADDNVVAVRGQTMLIESDFDELVMLQGSQYTYAIPRMYTGAVIIGGVSQEGNFSGEVDENLRADILGRVQQIAGKSLGAVDLIRDVKKDIVAFRPGRKGGYRLETEGNNVVHAYGFGSLGYVYSYGAALKVREHVEFLQSKSRL